MTFRILDTGIAAAQENMDCDGRLLDSLDPAGDPILHLYEWAAPSATFGYFADPAKHLDLEKAERRGVHLARRATGGGIVFHIWDFAFSFLMPSGHRKFSLNTLENYRFVNSAALEAVSELFSLKETPFLIAENFASASAECQNFCMAKPTQYDVVYKGKKIVGAAQRKRKQGYLHQGTISLASPHFDLLRDLLLSKKAVLDAMESYTFAPLGLCCDPTILKRTRHEVRDRLIQKLVEKL